MAGGPLFKNSQTLRVQTAPSVVNKKPGLILSQHCAVSGSSDTGVKPIHGTACGSYGGNNLNYPHHRYRIEKM